MTPAAVLVLVVGLLVVLAIAATALMLDARPRSALRRAPSRWPARPAMSPPRGPTPPAAGAAQTTPIDSGVAREDPPTIFVPRPEALRDRRPDDPVPPSATSGVD